MRHAAEDGRHSHASMMSPSASETAALVRSVKPKLGTDHQREVAESLARRIERRAERVPSSSPMPLMAILVACPIAQANERADDLLHLAKSLVIVRRGQ
jgi:hypothetical protein